MAASATTTLRLGCRPADMATSMSSPPALPPWPMPGVCAPTRAAAALRLNSDVPSRRVSMPTLAAAFHTAPSAPTGAVSSRASRMTHSTASAHRVSASTCRRSLGDRMTPRRPMSKSTGNSVPPGMPPLPLPLPLPPAAAAAAPVASPTLGSAKADDAGSVAAVTSDDCRLWSRRNAVNSVSRWLASGSRSAPATLWDPHAGRGVVAPPAAADASAEELWWSPEWASDRSWSTSRRMASDARPSCQRSSRRE